MAPLAKAGVPLLHVCGGLDPWLETQTREVEKRYEELGGQITVILKEGVGHYPFLPDGNKFVFAIEARRRFFYPKTTDEVRREAKNSPLLTGGLFVGWWGQELKGGRLPRHLPNPSYAAKASDILTSVELS